METIKALQTKNFIADMIKKEIIKGVMKEGEELTQEELASKLGVSRMPVREALQLLEQDGFVTRLNNRHIKVNGVDKTTVLRNIRILSAFEKETAAMLIEENKDISKLAEAAKMYKASIGKDIADICEQDLNFHESLSKSMEDEYLRNMHSKLIDTFFSYLIRKFNIDFGLTAAKASEIAACIQEKDSDNMMQSIDEYYKMIADAKMR